MTTRSNGKLPVASADELLAIDDVISGGKTITVPEWGYSVIVRGLTRGEARTVGEEGMSATEAEAYTLATALLEPKLTVEQARTLVTEKGYAGTERVLQEILSLSGMGAGFRPGDTG